MIAEDMPIAEKIAAAKVAFEVRKIALDMQPTIDSYSRTINGIAEPDSE